MVAAIVLVVGMARRLRAPRRRQPDHGDQQRADGGDQPRPRDPEDARSVDYDKLTPTDMVRRAAGQAGDRGSARRGRSSAAASSTRSRRRSAPSTTRRTRSRATPPANVCTPQAPVPAGDRHRRPENQPDDFRRVDGRTLSLEHRRRRDRTINQTALVNNPSGGLGPRITDFDPPTRRPGHHGQRRDLPDDHHDRRVRALEQRRHAQRRRRLRPAARPRGPPTGRSARRPPRSTRPPRRLAGAVHGHHRPRRHLHGHRPGVRRPRHRRRHRASRSCRSTARRPITVDRLRRSAATSYQSVIEFQWKPNPERDIIGYEVYERRPRQHDRQRQRLRSSARPRDVDGHQLRQLHELARPATRPTTSSRSTRPTSRTGERAPRVALRPGRDASELGAAAPRSDRCLIVTLDSCHAATRS